MSTTTATAVIEQLRCMFTHLIHGIPETLVLNNGPQFMLDEFTQLHFVPRDQEMAYTMC